MVFRIERQAAVQRHPNDVMVQLTKPFVCLCCIEEQRAGLAVDSYAFQGIICMACDEAILLEGDTNVRDVERD